MVPVKHKTVPIANEQLSGLLKEKAGYLDVYGNLNLGRKVLIVHTTEGCFAVKKPVEVDLQSALGLRSIHPQIGAYWKLSYRVEIQAIKPWIQGKKWSALAKYWASRLRPFWANETLNGKVEKTSGLLWKITETILKMPELEIVSGRKVLKIYATLARARYPHAKVVDTKDDVYILFEKSDGSGWLCPTCGEILKVENKHLECVGCAPGRLIPMGKKRANHFQVD